VPSALEEGVLYVSVEFRTVVHLCCCGCGKEVIAPLTPADWTLTFNGETVSLDPSIGNWSFACQSHYWITNGRVLWADRMTVDEIEYGRRLDRAGRGAHFSNRPAPPSVETRRHAIWQWFGRRK
jgi:hypothetical protein